MKFKIGAAQFKPQKGRVEDNLDTIARAVHEAADQLVDLLVFPEAATTGYILEGGVAECALTPQELTVMLAERTKSVPRPIDVSLGFYERTDTRPANSSAYFELGNGQSNLLSVYRKFFLPTYGVFDEARFHTQGNKLGVTETRFGKVGNLICEDVWHSILGSMLCAAGARIVLVHAASPARGLKQEKPANLLRYERMAKALSEEHCFVTAVSMLVGFEGGKGYTGGSFIVAPDGQVLCQADILDEQIVAAEVDTDWVARGRGETPLAEDLIERWPEILAEANKIQP